MKTRIITARLKFSPRKAGGDMSEAQLSDWLANGLNFADGLDVDTVLDGDPLSALTGKGVIRRLADAVRKPDPAAVMMAALRLALPVCADAYYDALAVQENPTGDFVDTPAENAGSTAAALAAWEAVKAAINAFGEA
jgi:hypothetical protein